MEALKQLRNLHFENWRKQYPNLEARFYAKPKYSPNTTNGKTKCIMDYVRLKGGIATRNKSEGSILNTKRTYVDVIGRDITIGETKRIYSNTTNGVSDITAVYKGVFIAIEIKNHLYNEKQSEAQKAYEKSVIAAGGYYVIARTFEAFVEYFNELFELIEEARNE